MLRASELAAEFYRRAKTKRLPYYAKNQLLRAAMSVVLNLEEGRGRVGKKDRVRFFQIALGSVRECQAISVVEDLRAEMDVLDHLGASVFKLIRNS